MENIEGTNTDAQKTTERSVAQLMDGYGFRAEHSPTPDASAMHKIQMNLSLWERVDRDRGEPPTRNMIARRSFVIDHIKKHGRHPGFGAWHWQE